ncbi:MAG TPA: hypothetical protein VGM59_06135, partial [Dongiaceae bacterium]
QWRFRLTAPAHVAIDLSRGMRAFLVAEQGGATHEAVTGGETWKGELPAGSYVLRATTLEPNNRFDYTVSVAADELMAGLSWPVDLPADIPLSIGSDAVLEIGSFGPTDVRAWLYDDHDRLVATNDDRPNDWNFAITGRMQPGFYRLHVEGVGAAEGHVAVSVYQAEEQPEPALAVGGDTQLSGPKVHIVPLQSAAGDLLVASADANGPAIGLGIEVKEQAGTWRTLAENTGRSPWLAVPTAGAKADYRLRVWSIDRSTDPIRLQTRMVTPRLAASSDFTGTGVPLQPVPGIEPPLGIAAIAIDAAGAFRLAPPLPDIEWSTESGRALAGDAAGIVFGNKGTFWFGARLQGDAAKVVASRVVPGEEAVALTVPGSDRAPTIIADPVSAKDGPQLWLAESRLGQPGIYALGLFPAMAPGSAVTIEPTPTSDAFDLDLWNAGDPATPLPLSMRKISFAAPIVDTLDWGIADRKIVGRQALSFTLPKGMKRLQLALPAGTAVVLQGEDNDAIWSGDTALAITEDTRAENLLVLSTVTTDARLGVTLVPLPNANATPTLGNGRLFKRYFASEGVIRLRVNLSQSEMKAVHAGKELRIAFSGAVKSARTFREDDDLTWTDVLNPVVAGKDTVDITHGAGLVVAWIEGGDSLGKPASASKATQIEETTSVKLTGVEQQLDFVTVAAKLLHLKTMVPVIAQFKSGNGAETLRVSPQGANLNLYLPKGTTPITLYAVAGSLSGIAEATLSDIAPIGEGLGPKAQLAPGESRLYSFAVKDERDIGVGVRGSVDTAHCRVLDADGNEIGAGVVQMLHLKAGTYLLAVDAPADGNAIEVQPALVGVAAPDGSPPDEVKRGYLELAGLKPKQQE